MSSQNIPTARLNIIYVPIGDVKPWSNNPKKHNAKAILESIKTFSPTQPMLVQKGTNRIIAGHGRLEAFQALGYKEVPIIELDMNDKQAKAYTLVDNQTVIAGGWDDKLLKLNLEEIKLESPELDMRVFGFDDKQLGTAGKDDKFDVDAATESVGEPITKMGDVITLGDHRLMCGDSTKREDVEKLMNGTKADLVFTSPPYNAGIDYNQYDDNKTSTEYLSLLNSILENVVRSMNDGRIIAWNIGVTPKASPYRQGVMLEDAGLSHYRNIVWKKTGAQIPLFQNSRKKPIARNYLPDYQHELIMLFSKGKPELGSNTEMPEEIASDVWDVCQFSAGGKGHPAAFPVKLPQYAMLALTSKCESVLDPFGGSGTTMIACEQTGRACYMMELDPKYCDVIVQRWEALTGKKAVRP